MSESTTKARDGATIAVESFGRGPGVVVVYGGAVCAKDYRRFAHALADRCTVHLYNRRGRPGGAALPDTGYTVQVDIDDIAAVVERTGATRLFGHSGGALPVLQAAKTLPIEKLALFDPGVQVDGLTPTHYLDDFEKAVNAKDYPRAIAEATRGLRSAGRLADLPFGVQILMGKLFLLTPYGEGFKQTIHTVPAEAREALKYAGSADLYASLTAEVLLASGSRSPRYYAPTNERLAAAIPGARAIVIPKSGHNGPNVARPAFVKPFTDFFA